MTNAKLMKEKKKTNEKSVSKNGLSSKTAKKTARCK